MLAAIITRMQERSQLKYSFARKLIILDPRLIAAEPGRAVYLLTKLVDKQWRTPELADDIWMQLQEELILAKKKKNRTTRNSTELS